MKTLKIQNLNGCQDRDIIMFHACFQVLKDFVEKECISLTNTAGHTILLDRRVEYCIGDKYTYDLARRQRKVELRLKKLYKWYENKDNWTDYPDITIKEKLTELIKLRQFLWT